MRSTFMGLETNKRGLYTQQSALYTTGHNISNANTLGYSRQRVNMEVTAGYPGVGLNAGTMPGFIGTGVQAGSIQRIRDGFIDQQFRQETTKFGYWESQSKAISQMEDVLTEPSYYGLQKTLSEFWQSLQDLATHPNESGSRAVVISKGQAVADSFNYMHKSLTEIQTNLGTEIEHSTKDINSILKQIADVNDQIKSVEPNGYIPNDLYDQRDMLLDKLSEFVPIEVEYKWSGGRAVEGKAEGWAIVRLKLGEGDPVVLVHGNKNVELEPNPKKLLDEDTGENKAITGLKVLKGLDESGGEITDNREIIHSHLLDRGKLKSLMNSYGVEGTDKDGKMIAKGLYPDMIANLNKMAKEFAEEFNEIHSDGFPLKGEKPTNTNWFFVREDPSKPFSADNLKVNELIADDPSLLRASSQKDQEGKNDNALKLAELQFKQLSGLNNATVETFFQGVIGNLGVAGQEANKLMHNTGTLLGAVEHRRASISSVSLDEEMTDMIRFQQAYNASARMITVIDETLDKIVNGMGVVGR